MKWTDDGIVIEARSLGEGKLILTLFTRDHGRALGVFQLTKTNRAYAQLGNPLQATWVSRLPDQLGRWQLDPVPSIVALLYAKPAPLMALQSACVLLNSLLAEHDPHPVLFDTFQQLLIDLKTPQWAERYVQFEIDLLQELGFGLSLNKCAVTNETGDLTHVSPRTGKAVSSVQAEPYKDKLLELPTFLRPEETSVSASLNEIRKGLDLTGYFLERHVLSLKGFPLPAVRQRLRNMKAIQPCGAEQPLPKPQFRGDLSPQSSIEMPRPLLKHS